MATEKQKRAAENLVENGGNVSKAMQEAGYSESTAHTPGKLTNSKGWEELMDEYLPDSKLAEVHQSLLTAKQLDHMVFPLTQTDDDIKQLLESTGCKVRKVSRSDTQTHCWFWSPNTRAQKDAVELAYKLKGRLTQKVAVSADFNPIEAIIEATGLRSDIETIRQENEGGHDRQSNEHLPSSSES